MRYIIIPFILLVGYFFPPHYEVSVEYKSRLAETEVTDGHVATIH